MKHIMFFIAGIFLINSLVNAQKSIDFKDFKRTENGKVIYFGITGLVNDDLKESLTEIFKNDPNILFCKLGKNAKNQDWCQMEINNKIDAYYIQSILLSNNLDYEMTTVINPLKRIDGMPEHYPVYNNTSNSDADKIKYENEKNLWLRNYPKEVQALLGKNYYDIISNESFYLNEPPSFIDTGNKAIDEMKYEKRKTEWKNTHVQDK